MPLFYVQKYWFINLMYGVVPKRRQLLSPMKKEAKRHTCARV